MVGQRANSISAIKQNPSRILAGVAECAGDDDRLAFTGYVQFVLLACGMVHRASLLCGLCALFVKRTISVVCRLRFGPNVLKDAGMNSVDDVVRPQMPVGRRPHGVVIPRCAFEPRTSAGKRGQQELPLL